MQVFNETFMSLYCVVENDGNHSVSKPLVKKIEKDEVLLERSTHI